MKRKSKKAEAITASVCGRVAFTLCEFLTQRTRARNRSRFCSLLPLTFCLFSSQSALDPAGPQAGRIIGLWWLMFCVTGAIFLAVIFFLLASLFRKRSARDGDQENAPETRPDAKVERRMSRVVLSCIAATVLILFFFLVQSFLTGRALDSVSAKEHLTVKVTGHQWWWEIQYENQTAGYVLTTANEIHIPQGEPVLFKLTSTDVIHSFWVPNLHGKTDLIPGHEAVTWIRADRAGIYRGQCAEFCGHQHAHMSFTVVVEPYEQFKSWYDSQLAAARSPSTPQETRGQQVFLSSTCVMCHTIRGTDAGARVGPELTHVASRSTIAAGTLENTREHLAAWVADSQQFKPGNRMPQQPLDAADMQALVDYLQSLK